MNIALAFGIEFAIQTALIFAGLWIMIAIQKLNNNLLGLLGTAALTSVLEMVLDRLLGTYLSTSIVIVVMLFCVWKVTGASNPFDIDVIFTVAVGGAVTFAMNLFLIGALMGDLRPSADEEDSNEDIAAVMEEMEEADERPVALSASNQVVMVKSNAAPVVAQKPTSSVKPVSATATGPLSDATRESIKLKGLNSGGKPSAIISDGKRTFTLGVGETWSLQTADGKVVVKLERVTSDDAVVSLNGEPLTLTLW